MYGKAHNWGAEEGDPGYYSQLMVITAEILEQHAEGASADAARRSRLRQIASSRASRIRPTSGAGVAVGDALLLTAIADGEMSAKEEDEIVEAYLEPWRRGGSRLKLSSVTEQLAFLAAMLQEGPEATGDARRALIEILDRIRGRIRKPR